MSDRIAIYKYVDIVREHWLKDDLHLSEFTIAEATNWLNALKNKRFQKNIWKQQMNEHGVNDTILGSFRFQLTNFQNNTPWFNEIKQQVQNKLNSIMKHFKIVFQSVLWSTPGGPIQREHQDYHSLDFPVFSIIVSMDDSTTLDIVEGSSRRRKIRILQGECLIFTGELLHAGSSYTAPNRRLFFKAIPFHAELPTKSGDTVYTSLLYCDKCHYSFTDRFQRDHHNRQGN